jgi:hypothetical protein
MLVIGKNEILKGLEGAGWFFGSSWGFFYSSVSSIAVAMELIGQVVSP